MATSPSSVQQSIASTPATPSTQSVQARADPAWDYCIEMIDPNGKKFWKCMYCEKEFKGGGIHRIKQHLAGKKGDAVGCKKVPYDVRYKMQQNLKEIDERKNKGQNDLKDMQVLEDNVASLEVQPPVQHITQSAAISSSQGGIKRKSTEDGSNFFAPRTTVGAQPSIRF
jgi:BED zinc finger